MSKIVGATSIEVPNPQLTTSSSIRRLNMGIQALAAQASAWLFDWTPFVLVSTYYIASTAVYTSATDGTIKVFYFYMAVNFYIAACTVIEAFLGISPLRESRNAADEVDRNNNRFPTPDDELPIIDLVIVAYLPNEQDIVKDQVCYALDELVYPRSKLKVNLGRHSRLDLSESKLTNCMQCTIHQSQLNRSSPSWQKWRSSIHNSLLSTSQAPNQRLTISTTSSNSTQVPI